MKIVTLPKSAQKGIHGAVVCVQSSIADTVQQLPRTMADGSLIKVKLKRKLEYKGHHLFQTVNSNRIYEAATYLKTLNPHYRDIEIVPITATETSDPNSGTADSACVNSPVTTTCNSVSELVQVSCHADNSQEVQIHNSCPGDLVPDSTDQSTQPHTTNTMNVTTNNETSAPLFTCLQPVNIAQYVVEEYDNILCLAPGQNQQLVSIFKSEGQAFVTLFPDGQNTYEQQRQVRISPKRYFNARLLPRDSRFASNPEYTFFAQYTTELHKILSSIAIAMRKGSKRTSAGRLITSSMLKDRQCVHQILPKNDGYYFMKNIRRTPAYWETIMRDLFAMVRQLGVPTWFCSFSAADRRWPEIVESILEQQRKPVPKQIDWSTHCQIISGNPVTAARMFEHRMQALIHEGILSPSLPMGEVVDYFHRVEFQQRVWPHIHCLFSIEDAPKFGHSPDPDVISFIDQCVLCHMPSEAENPVLHEIVKNVQTHSKTHSKSFKKGGKMYRFNFPKLPSQKTFISRSTSADNKNMDKTTAAELLKKLWDSFYSDTSYPNNTGEVFKRCGITQEQLEQSVQTTLTKETLFYQRKPSDIWINNYNTTLLQAWNANMDIQFVLDAYSCIMYIVSYISKAEREMGTLLKNAQQHCPIFLIHPLHVGFHHVLFYLNNREVIVMVSVYRISGMHMKQCSRQVIFIPIDPDNHRLSLPLSQLQKREEDSEEVWLPNLIDKYLQRPLNDTFRTMCLATFASDYRYSSTTQPREKRNSHTTDNTANLGNGLGSVKKRAKKSAVIRYPRVRIQYDREKYYYSIMRLYLPFTKTHFRPPEYSTYEDYFLNGMYGDTPVHEIVA
ncbi:hypothetical protein HOLleu_42048 [Holothuria leucospilota]|uniref:Helitron helicase-like domain-containing protein n=1 Tax=Holothuria leucospilota TaxID=206669 RepID=A0A9Q0YAV8_HOLLE|nr:hypothetical protein HOLleu_42048 [Holothuria leucospilota]